MADSGNPNLLHSALRSPNVPLSIPTILACPIPFSLLPPEKLLPELGHELKTPLTGIMGLAQVMQRSSSGERSAQYAELIYQKSQQLLTAINDLLDLTQLCTQQFVLQLQSVEFYSVFDTALQTVQRMSGSPLILKQLAPSPPEAQRFEQWMIADRARLEQLLIHLLGYLCLQGVQELTLHLISWGPWIRMTLHIPTLTLSDAQLISLSWTNQASDPAFLTVPNQSGTVLKFLLARRLAQLQGAEMSCRSSLEFGTEVTVLFPRDLTCTTCNPEQLRADSGPVWLILAQQSGLIEEIIQLFPENLPPILIARSLVEAQEKIQMLSPAVLMVDGQMAEDWGLAVLQDWLDQWLNQEWSPLNLVWVGRQSFPTVFTSLYPGEVWERPLSALLPKALSLNPVQSRKAVQQDLISSPSTNLNRPLTLLQLDSFTPIISQAVLGVLEELSLHHDCSIISVNDISQAELLARIWKPQVIICLDTLPQWVEQIPSTSLLVTLPIFVLQTSASETAASLGVITPIPYLVQSSKRPSALAKQLYQRLVEAIAQAPTNPLVL